MSEQSRREFVTMGLATAGAAWAGLPAAAQEPDELSELAALTLKQASDLVRRRDVSPVELTEACLNRIDAYNLALGAFITVARDDALRAARRLEAEQARRNFRGPLHGIPVALKDNIDTAGISTTGGSALFADRVPAEDAFVVARLKAAGAIVIGKLNLHEFALGGTSAVNHVGPVHNPWAFDRHPGGSSGGNAAAIAAELCFGSLGTDTGGSIRIPASYCGIVGLKPTNGRVSNRGVIPNSWTFDTVGPMTRTVEDAALMLEVVAGYDERDPSSVDVPAARYSGAIGRATTSLRLGVPRTPFFDDLEPEVATAVETALGVLRALTAELREVEVPPSPGLGISSAEIYAYHAPWIAESPESYQAPTRRIVAAGADARADDYARALREVTLARRKIAKSFASVDLLITPTTGGTAGPIPPPAAAGAGDASPAARDASAEAEEAPGEGGPQRRGGARGFANTSYFSYYGLPAMSIPCGFTASGLPIGLQISGGPFAESTVLALAHAYEQATEWHTRRPHLPA
jgi:aspartyl-tRNA(Asn)/glutamyl-tRNA(Gln) amidotransferase subunit A